MRYNRLIYSTQLILAPLLTLSLLVVSCEFRDPDKGYDRNWVPDHDAGSPGEQNTSTTEQESEAHNATGSLDDGLNAAPYKRPKEIAADTSEMEATEGEWSEMNGTVETSYRVYRDGGKIAMIVEQTAEALRTYYYNSGTLFYFSEVGNNDSYNLTVEFDDFGDVRGARRMVGGRQASTNEKEFAAIVEHAVELRLATEESAE